MQYRSIGDLSQSVAAGAWKVPADIDLIVGIPRSGLLAGSMLALHLNLPIVDLDAYLNGTDPRIGRTSKHTLLHRENSVRKVLIIDDTVDTGISMARIRDEVHGANLTDEVLFCAIYGSQISHDGFDIVFEKVDTPRIFEWNMMRHKRLGEACFDIDGLLSGNPDAVDLDESGHESLANGGRPLHIPKLPVAHLVTSRLDRCRPQVEGWLKDMGIEYGKLWMRELPGADVGAHHQNAAAFKAQVYRECGANLLIECDDAQAEEIALLSSQPVLSIGGQRMVWPDDPEANRRHIRKAGWVPRKVTMKSRVKRATLHLCRNLHLPIGAPTGEARPVSRRPAGFPETHSNRPRPV